MPYNTSKAVVNRNKRYLDDMLEARRTITWPAHNPQQQARKIREAMYASTKHKDFERYHPLYDWFRIRGTNPNYVEAEYIGPPTSPHPTYVPDAMTIEEASDVNGVVGACIKFGIKADELRFPNVRLSESECLMIYNWGQAEHPRWNLINHEDAGVTMTRKRDLDELFLWRPSGERDE